MQYTPEWVADRAGVITASVWANLNEKPSTAKYKNALYDLIFERLTGMPANADNPKTFYMNRGNEMEDSVIARFEAETFLKVERGAWFKVAENMTGASPDGVIVGPNLGLEIKYPKESTMIGYLLNPEDLAADYMAQVNFQMFVCGFSGVWLVAGNKYTDLCKVFIPRDEATMLAIGVRVAELNELINKNVNKLK